MDSVDCDLSTLNIHKICRVCLTESEQMYSIYSELYEEKDVSNEATFPCIYEILTSISSIRVQADDGLPSMICTKCIDLAHISFKFQKQCNESQIIFDNYLKQYPIIKETNNIDDLSSLEQINKSDLIQESRSNIVNTDEFLFVDSETDIKKDFKIENDTQPIQDSIKDHFSDSDTEYVDPLDICTNGNNYVPKIEKCEVDETSKNSTEKVYSCNLCDRTYKYSNSLRVHMRNHTQENPYSCKICGKKFKQCGSLVYHQRTHTGEQPYACKICGKRYKQSGTLTAHMRVHTGQKPFLCSICGRGFRQAPDLGYHMRFHTKEKPYMCNVCGKTMSMQSHLVQHMRTHTGERPFKCTVCEKAFPSSTRLKRHAIIHTGLKPYTCEVCSKSFNRMSTLRVHSKIHTDERSYICPVCNKGFIQSHALRSHLISHSSELTIKHMQQVI